MKKNNKTDEREKRKIQKNTEKYRRKIQTPMKKNTDTHKMKVLFTVQHVSQKHLQQSDQKLMVFARQGNKSVIFQKTICFSE